MRKVPVKPSPSKGKVSFCQEFLIQTISSFGFRYLLGWLFVFRSNGWVAQMCACAACAWVSVWVCGCVFVCVCACVGEWLICVKGDWTFSIIQHPTQKINLIVFKFLFWRWKILFSSFILSLSFFLSLNLTYTLSLYLILILNPIILNSSFSLTHFEDTKAWSNAWMGEIVWKKNKVKHDLKLTSRKVLGCEVKADLLIVVHSIAVYLNV